MPSMSDWQGSDQCDAQQWPTKVIKHCAPFTPAAFLAGALTLVSLSYRLWRKPGWSGMARPWHCCCFVLVIDGSYSRQSLLACPSDATNVYPETMPLIFINGHTIRTFIGINRKQSRRFDAGCTFLGSLDVWLCHSLCQSPACPLCILVPNM